MTLEIQILALDRCKNVAGLNLQVLLIVSTQFNEILFESLKTLYLHIQKCI